MDMFKKITKRDCVIPADFEPELRDLIDKLLQVDLTRRLGNLHKGVEEVMEQPYFKDIKWDKIYDQSLTSPYQPKVSGPGDAHNFETYAEEPVRWYGEGVDKYGDTFLGW